jgi:RNA polymerase sigma-70 factor (ECF subfamily)
MDAQSSDESLMLDYASGNAASFDVLYARHRGPLFRFLLRGLSQRALAEECFQETWSRVVAARQRYRPEAAFSTWLYQIAHRLLIDHYRRTSHRATTPDGDELLANLPAPSSAQPEQLQSDFEQRRRLQLALAELPDEQRIALQLRLEQELSLEAIGEITGVGRETVKSRLRYALDRLKGRLSP